jgi:hypothetical protein
MFYPEKCKANSFQTAIFQSFLCGLDLGHLIRPELQPVLADMRMRFHDYFDPWQPDVPHKRYRWKPDVFLKDSPFDLLPRLVNASLITYIKPYREYCTSMRFRHAVHTYDLRPADGPFSVDAYYRPVAVDGALVLRDFLFTNSAAIALFPLLHFLGIRRVYFLGMDMSMLGSMEYAALYTFKSLGHYAAFFGRARAAFGSSFPRSRRAEIVEELRWGGAGRLRDLFRVALWRKALDRHARFMRPLSERRSLRAVLSFHGIQFVNVFEPFRFALPIEGISNISFERFLRE